jgi:GH25 family lysozyme M1 (1,4-beta-N-acetylmuramidase)
MKRIFVLCLLAALLLTCTALPGLAAETAATEENRSMGVDVADWNGNIDWAKAAKEIDFAILCIGQKMKLETRTAANAAGCEQNGIDYGVYYVSSAASAEDAQAEAELVLSGLEGLQPELPVFFDVERSMAKKLSSETLQAVVRTFCEAVEEAGYQPGLYTYTDLMEQHFSEGYFNTLPKWVSQVDAEQCSYTGKYIMWQYSWSGRVAGIAGDVDLNYLGDFGTQSCDHPGITYS